RPDPRAVHQRLEAISGDVAEQADLVLEERDNGWGIHSACPSLVSCCPSPKLAVLTPIPINTVQQSVKSTRGIRIPLSCWSCLVARMFGRSLRHRDPCDHFPPHPRSRTDESNLTGAGQNRRVRSGGWPTSPAESHPSLWIEL